ncbi:MAG: hypothetical protein ACO1Q7_13205 [Gemmatimonas sp.]
MTALLATGCKDVRDKLDERLYAKPDLSLWTRDSTLAVSKPPVLLRVIRKGDNQYLLPIALLDKATPTTLRMTKRGWAIMDINLFFSGNEVTPVRDGFALASVPMTRGMWENPSSPLDTIPGCQGATLPLGLAPLPPGTQLAVANFKLPSGMQTLSQGEIEDAIREVPLLVTPTAQVSAAQLANYTRTIHQIPRVKGSPAILLSYHDERPITDTSVVGQRRPRHLQIILEKGVYTYRPSWVYSTTGGKTDKPLLRFLDILDADGDGNSEIFFYVEVQPGISFTLAYRQKNDTWVEYWRRSPARCDM